MKMTGMETDRDRSPLMKDLHDLGLKHGVTFVVVTQPIDGGPHEQHGFLIDHKDDTTAKDVYVRWLQAGIWLIQATSAVEDYIAEQREMEAENVTAPQSR